MQPIRIAASGRTLPVRTAQRQSCRADFRHHFPGGAPRISRTAAIQQGSTLARDARGFAVTQRLGYIATIDRKTAEAVERTIPQSISLRIDKAIR
jgi:hypothetical protein